MQEDEEAASSARRADESGGIVAYNGNKKNVSKLNSGVKGGMEAFGIADPASGEFAHSNPGMA